MAAVVIAVAASSSALAANPEAIFIFGGSDHKVFLGCFNCQKFDPNSVDNEYGKYGNQYSVESIFNHFSPYGDKSSDTSACSTYASDPPVLVNGRGGFYGKLTLNPYQVNAISLSQVLQWLQGVCDR